MFITILNKILLLIIQNYLNLMQLQISEAGSTEESFFFEPLPCKFNQIKQTKQTLTKWGLIDTMRVGSFRFNQSFNQFQLESFLKDLFGNPNVRYTINNIKYQSQSVAHVQYEKLRCTELSTEMFDNLQKNSIVNQDYIAKTFGDQFEGIQICDKLRECLLVQDSQYYCVFNQIERKQFLFKVFQLLVVGGSLNQYEDHLSPYLEWTKLLYKNLVSVRKQPQSGSIFIDSIAIQIKKIDKDIFKKDYNPQNIIYVVINPSTRTVNIVSNNWVKYW